MKTREIISLIVICLVVVGLGSSGSFFVKKSLDWYQSLNKPWFTPPDWVFGPVWTVLYIMMASAFFLVWRKGTANPKGKTAVACFIFQFVFNLLWTPIFFGLKMPMLAFGEIVVLWLAVCATAGSFYRVSKPAAILLIPYFLWVSFAAVLNEAIYMMNAN